MPAPSHRAFAAAAAVLALTALLVGVPGGASLPLDMHEVYVVQSVREMAARGDWILPYMNGEPRLNKPPLNYWLTAAVAWLGGELPRAAEWHARAVSVVGGIGMVLATIAMGTMLYGRGTGLLAGLLLATSVGLFGSMHDGRPDMLYAALCMAALAALLWSARRAARGEGTWTPALLMWLAVALATLSKGPHMPALMLAGGVVQLRREGRHWREIVRIVRPLAGLALALALCAPWWLALQARIGEARLAASQLGGELLVPKLSRLGNPYYLYRPLELLLPWLPLALLALAPGQAWQRRDWGWLLWPLAVCILGLSLAPQYRLVYILPLLGVMALAFAHALAPLPEGKAAPSPLAWSALALQYAVAIALLGFALYRARAAVPLAGLVLAGLLALVASATVFAWFRRRDAGALGVIAAAAVLIAASWPLGTAGRAWWSTERFEARALALRAAERLPREVPLAALEVNPVPYVYYAERRVRELHGEPELAAALAAAPGGRLGLVARGSQLGALAARYAWDEIARYPRAGDDDVLVLVSGRRP